MGPSFAMAAATAAVAACVASSIDCGGAAGPAGGAAVGCAAAGAFWWTLPAARGTATLELVLDVGLGGC